MTLKPAGQIPIMDTGKMVEDIRRISEQVDTLEAEMRKALGIEYRKVNMDPLFDGGGFFRKRDTAAIAAMRAMMRTAFFAGFKRSDSPAPSEERIEAAWQEWIK